MTLKFACGICWRASFFLAAGCATIPQAGMIYSQHTMGGLEVAVGDTSVTTSPAHIQIGFKHDFGTYIPMAALQEKDKGTLIKLLASGNVPEALVTEETKVKIADALETAIANGSIFDVISVFSSFDSAFKAATQTPRGEVTAGNVFATGFAARVLVKAKLAASCVRLQELIEAAKDDGGRKKQLEAISKTTCSIVD